MGSISAGGLCTRGQGVELRQHGLVRAFFFLFGLLSVYRYVIRRAGVKFALNLCIVPLFANAGGRRGEPMRACRLSNPLQLVPCFGFAM